MLDHNILTFFTNLKMVSVYSVYSLVSNGIKSLVNACLSGIAHTVGQAYARKNWKELHQKLDIYEYIVFMLVFFFFSVAILLITPFVALYTKGIVDADYNQPIFGFLLLLSEAFYLIKMPHLNLAYSANKFKEITMPAYMEAILNIVISVALVRKLGLIGLSIGTICGMVYRMVFHVYYTSKIVPERPQNIFYKKLCIFTIATFLGVIICLICFPIDKITLLNWIVHAILYSSIIGSILFWMSMLFFGNELKYFVSYMKK